MNLETLKSIVSDLTHVNKIDVKHCKRIANNNNANPDTVLRVHVLSGGKPIKVYNPTTKKHTCYSTLDTLLK